MYRENNEQNLKSVFRLVFIPDKLQTKVVMPKVILNSFYSSSQENLNNFSDFLKIKH